MTVQPDLIKIGTKVKVYDSKGFWTAGVVYGLAVPSRRGPYVQFTEAHPTLAGRYCSLSEIEIIDQVTPLAPAVVQ